MELADGLGVADATRAGATVDGAGSWVVAADEGSGAFDAAGLSTTAVSDETGSTASSALAVDTPVMARPTAITIVVIAARVLFMTCSWVREIYVGLRQGAFRAASSRFGGRWSGCDADVGGVSSAG